MVAPVHDPVLTDPYSAADPSIRRTERLDHLFEARCDWITSSGRGGRLAVDADGLRLTYAELDARANRLARYLQRHGTRAGDRVGLLLDRPADSCVAVLGVLKAGAAYVPLDTGTPVERMARVVADARVRTVLSTSETAGRVPRVDRLAAEGAELVCLDRVARAVDGQDPRRLVDDGTGGDGRIAFVSYPSGADAPLAGVAVDHAGLCTVVRGASEVYDLLPSDRVYQGLPVAAHGAVEEMWVPWACGATLVPAPAGGLRGRDLHAFLRSRRVTALRCDPDVLATIEDDLPGLRFLLVAGNSCPRDLVERWHRPGRRLLGGYAPAGTATTAVWTELSPYRPPTIGVPLPGYRTVVLDPADPHRGLPHGEIGEIGIAGIGLACARADGLPDDVFVPDLLGIPANPSGRIRRTGHLGRVNADGEIEHCGQVDLRPLVRPEPAVVVPARAAPPASPPPRRPRATSPPCSPTSSASRRCRSTGTSSTTSAPTRWSWPASAPASGNVPTCRRRR